MKITRPAIILNLIIIIIITFLQYENSYIEPYFIKDLNNFNTLFTFKNYLIKNSNLFVGEYREFVNSLLLGESVNYILKVKMINTGIYHILSLSGMHISLLYGIMMYLTVFINNKYLKYVLIMCVIICYGILTGLKVSTFRAVIMCIIVLIGKLINRKSDTLNNLSIASIVILIINNEMIFSISYLLSFIIVCGIIVYSKIVKEIIVSLLNNEIKNRKSVKFIIDYISICIASYLTSIPLNLYFFGKTNMLSIVTNILIGFIVPFIFVLAFFTLVTGLNIFTQLCSALIDVIFNIVNYFSKFNTTIYLNETMTFIHMYILLLLTFLILYTINFLIKEQRKKNINGKTKKTNFEKRVF